MFLLGLSLPDHVEQICYRAQDSLWRQYGLASTRALPPLIVAGRLDESEAFDPRTAHSLLRGLLGLSLVPFTLQAVRAIDDVYVAPLTPSATCRVLRERLPLAADCALPPDSVFLGCREHPGLPRQPLGSAPLWPRPINTASAMVIEVVSAHPPCWWQTVAWRIAAEHKLTAAK